MEAKKREVLGKAVKQLRKAGEIPAVIYGKAKENQNLSLNRIEFEKLYRDHGTSAIILLDIDGNKKNVLIQEISFNPVNGLADHVDFYEVSMTEKITTMVPLNFIGDSSAVIELGGTLVTNKNEVEVECLPADLPPEIEVDITPLVDFETDIHVSDLKIPAGVEIKDDPEEMVATVEPPRSEEELAELEETPEAPEMPESEHGEAEAATEGEAAPEGEQKSE